MKVRQDFTIVTANCTGNRGNKSIKLPPGYKILQMTTQRCQVQLPITLRSPRIWSVLQRTRQGRYYLQPSLQRLFKSKERFGTPFYRKIFSQNEKTGAKLSIVNMAAERHKDFTGQK